MKYERVFITPKLAKGLLDKMPVNRRLKKPVMLKYANQMREGLWKEDTGEAIKIAKNGFVIDGQHRLRGLINADVSLWFLIISDLDEGIYDVLDSGSVRNSGDSFAIEGIKGANVIPSIIQVYHNLKENKFARGQNVHKNLSTTQLLTFYNNNVDLMQNVKNQTISWYKSFAKILPPSVLGGMYLFLKDIDKESSFNFINQLATGVSISNTSIHQLRQRLMKDKMGQSKMKPTLRICLIIRAWNYYRAGVDKTLRFDIVNEPYPIAI